MGSLAEAFLSKHAAKLSKSFKTRFIETLILYVVMQKTNFTQLAAFGSHNEKTYRSHFEKSGIDTVAFNLEMAKGYGRLSGTRDHAYQLTLKVFASEGIDWQRAFVEEPIEVMTDLMGPERMRQILNEALKRLNAKDG